MIRAYLTCTLFGHRWAVLPTVRGAGFMCVCSRCLDVREPDQSHD